MPGRTTRASKAKAASASAEKPTNESKVVTPPKKARNKSEKYFFFKMSGVDNVFIEGARAAKRHRTDYEGLIEEERGFSKKQAFEAFKKQHEDPLLKPKTAPTSSGPPSSAAAKIVSMMKNEKGCDRFHGYYKTTSNSSMAVIIIKAINQYDTDTWVFKPNFLAEIFNNLANNRYWDIRMLYPLVIAQRTA